MPEDFDQFVASMIGLPPKPAEAPATPEAPAAPELQTKPAPAQAAPIPLKPMSGKFGEGENLYDSDSAIQAGIQADKETGHYQSRVATGPTEGLILKHETHPTFYKTIEGEKEVGNAMYRSPEGRLYSFEASKAAPEGYAPWTPPTDFTKTLQDNKHLNFVERALNPLKNPVIQNEDGTVSTHRMASGEIDGKPVAYPTIIQNKDGTLTQLPDREAAQHAQASGEYIAFKNDEDAKKFGAGGYKDAATKLGAVSLNDPRVGTPLGLPVPQPFKKPPDVFDRMAKQGLIPEAPIPQVPDTFERTVGSMMTAREPGAGPVDVASLSPEAQKYIKDNAPGEGGILSSLLRGGMRGVAGTVKLAELAGEVVTGLGGPKELGDVLQFAGREGAEAINKLADYIVPRSAAAANMPKIDLDQFIDNPGMVVNQINDHLGNPEFWKTSVPEGLGSMIPLLVGGWIKAMRAAPAIKKLMMAGETVLAQTLAKQTAKSVGRLAYFTTAGMEGGNFYEDLKKFEKETGQQVPLHIKVVGTLSVGAINGALELVGLQQVGAGKVLAKMLNTKPAMDALEKVVTPTLFANVRKAFLGEMGQETGQQLVSNAFTQAGYNPNHLLTEGVAESALAGGFGGVAMGVPAHIYNLPSKAKEAPPIDNIDMTRPPTVAGGPVQQPLPGIEGVPPVKPPPLGAPTGVVETPPVEVPAPAPAPGPTTPAPAPAPTSLEGILDYIGSIEDMSFDDLVMSVQERLRLAQVIPAGIPQAVEATQKAQPLADTSTLGKEVAATTQQEQPRPLATPLGTPASMMAMVTSPEDVIGEGAVGKLFGEAGKQTDMQRFLYENGLTWEEVQAWDTTKKEDLQYEYEAWQEDVAVTEPGLPTGPAWEAFLDDHDPDKYLGEQPGRYKPVFEEGYWPSLSGEMKNGILDQFRYWAEEQGVELPTDLQAPPVTQEAAPQLAPDMLEQLKAAHQAAIEAALNEGRMTIDQATQLGHLATHATLSWTPPAAPAPAPAPVERPQNMVMSWEDFAAGNLPMLRQTIQAAHTALFDTEALATGNFYDGSFDIPRQGGILMARQSDLYRTDPAYRAKVEGVIADIASAIVDAHKKMNILRGVHIGGGFGIMYEGDISTGRLFTDPSTGMTPTGIEAGYALSPDDLSMAWFLMGADKYSAYYKGDVSIREALQNSLDAVLEAIKNKSITQGTIDIEVDGGTKFSVADNGIGMDPETIRDKFLGLFGSTKRDESGRFGKFGIAKAIILKPTRDATWTIETREFYFDETTLGAANKAPIMRVAPGAERVGTKISVDGKEYMVSGDGRKFVETTEVPGNVTLTWNGKEVSSPFQYLTPSQGPIKTTLKTVKVDSETTLRFTYYKDSGSSYNNRIVLRLSDKATGAKLTQNVKTAATTYGGREGLKGCLIVDVETKATVGKQDSKYPFKDSRDELKDFANKYVEKVIAELTEKPPPPPPPKRIYTTLGQRAEFKKALEKIVDDPDYQALVAYIDSLGLKRTPPADIRLGIEAGFGKVLGNVASIMQLVAYEAVVQYTAKTINVSSADGSSNSNYIYDSPYMVYGVLGDKMKAEFDPNNNTIGLNYMFTTPEMLADPHRMAHHLRDRANHELAHFMTPLKPGEDIDDHGTTYNANLSYILDESMPAFDVVLKITEKAMGKVATDIRTIIGIHRTIPPAEFDPKTLSPIELLGILKTLGLDEQTAPEAFPISKGQLELWQTVEEVNYGNVELFRPSRETREEQQAHLFDAKLEGDTGRAGRQSEALRPGGEPQYEVGAGDVGGGEGRLLPGGGVAAAGPTRTAPLGIPAGRRTPLSEPAGAGPAASGPVRAQRAQKIQAPVFFSKMQRHLEANLPGKGTGAELASLVDGWTQKGAFKQDEAKWMDLSGWLRGQQGTVTKQQVLDFVAQNNAEFEEIERKEGGREAGTTYLRETGREYVEQESEPEYSIVDLETGENLEYFDDEQDADERLTELQARDPEADLGIEEGWRDADYDSDSEVEVTLENEDGDSYVVRGSDAYGQWEIVDTPMGINAPRESFNSWDALEEAISALEAGEYGLAPKFDQYVMPDGEEYKEFQMILKLTKAELDKVPAGVPIPAKYRSSHWDENDVVVHMRVTTRIDQDGKRTLFIEEIQADWGQAYRKQVKAEKGIEARRNALLTRAGEIAAHFEMSVPKAFREAQRTDSVGNPKVIGPYQEELRDILESLTELSEIRRKAPRGVVKPPMEKTWHELAMKRLLRYAAENGFARIAWTTGQQQIDRYDLSKRIDLLNYAPHIEGGRLVGMKDGHVEVMRVGVSPDNLEEYIGKEAAEKLLATESGELIEGKPIFRLEGQDLKLGGEGMKGFYDKMLPDFMRKYGKQWGAQLEDADIRWRPAGDTVNNVPNDFWSWLYQQDPTRVPSDYNTAQIKEALAKFYKSDLYEPLMVHSMPVTESMKESVLYQGQPLWRLGDGIDIPGNVTTEVLQQRVGDSGAVKDLGSNDKYRRTWGIEFKNGLLLGIAESHEGELEVKAFVESDAQWAELGVDLGESFVTAAFKPMSVGGLVELAKGQGIRSVDHELWHFIKHWLLTEKERSMLDRRFKGNEEAEAEAYGAWNPKDRNPIFRKILEFARMVLNAITGYRTPEALFAAARSGTLYKRQAVENMAHGTPRAQRSTDREAIEAYKEEMVVPAPRAKTWKETLSNFKDIATIKANVIPALYDFWAKTYTEIFAEHAPIERLAKAAKKALIVGIPRRVGALLDWALAAHRGSQGFANHALVGGKESGVFLPKMESGYDTTETEAIMAKIVEAMDQSGGVVNSKVARLSEKLAAKMAEQYTTGDIEKVHDSLAVTCEPLRALAERRGMDVDQVFNDLFNVKMVAERTLELSGKIGARLKLIEKGTDPEAADAILKALQRDYGAEYQVLEDVSKGVRSWADAAIIEPLVRSGRLSIEIATQMRASNLFYIPFFRLMEEMNEKGFVGSGESVFEVRKIPVREIKGSERKIIDTLSMLHALVYNVADVAGRAQVAQTIAQIPLFSEAGGDIKVVRAKFFPVPVELKQETDPVLRSGLQEIADLLEVDVKVMQRVKSFRGALGVFIRAMQNEEKNGVITPVERTWIELMFGTTERTKAHEVGHAIDHKYSSVVGGKRVGGLIRALMRTPQMKKELRAIADQRASDSASPAFRKYIRQREEQVADFVNRYVNSNDQAMRLAPNVTKAFEEFIRVHPELNSLLTLRPSGQAEVMTIEGQTWTKSPFRPQKNSLMIYRNGKPSWVTMPEDVFKACMGMTRGDVGVLVKIAAKPASWLRAGAVLSPEFISRNPLRDVVMAWVFSRHGFGFTGWFEDIYKLAVGDEEAKALLARFHAGGGGFADVATMFVETQAIDVDKIMGKQKGIKYLSHPIEALREVSSFLENATRYSVYRQTYENLVADGMDKGEAHARAIHEARTVTLDFHRFGANPYVRTLNMIIPFFNASLQGVDKLGSELLGGDKARAMQVARRILLGITLPSVLLWAAFGDDDRIKKLESWERNLFWHIPIPGGPILRFPKPFEVGIMFGSIPERLLDYARNQDSTGLKKALEQAFDSLTPSPWPTIVRPFMEQYANWNFFMGRPIEDAAMKNLPVELRSKPWTSEAAKFFSAHFGKYAGISPVMFEQHVRNIFGGLGSNYALPMIDYSMRKAGIVHDIPKADEKWYLQTPFIRGMFSREPSGFRSKQAADFFENYTKAFTSDQGWKTLWKNGQMEDAAQMIKDTPEAIFARTVRKQMTALGKLRKERDHILRDGKLDGAQKREKLDALDKQVDVIMAVNNAMMHPKVMEQITAPVTTAIKHTAKTDKDVEKYYNLANQPIAKAYEKVTKDWKKYEAMGTTARNEAIVRLIKDQQAHPMPSGAGGKKKASYSVLGIPEKAKKGVDIFGEKGKGSGMKFELFPTK